VVVQPADMQGWVVVDDNGKGLGMGSFSSGPGTPPLGTGSARLVLTSGTAGWSFMGALPAELPLADITRLQYSTYVTQSPSVQAVALALNVDYDSDDATTGWQGRLVFEPYRNETVSTGSWQTWNTVLDSSLWFATGAPGNGKVHDGHSLYLGGDQDRVAKNQRAFGL
jgi:hypothetical protein